MGGMGYIRQRIFIGNNGNFDSSREVLKRSHEVMMDGMQTGFGR